MKIFISVCQDIHDDDDIKVWLNKQKAIDYAKNFMSYYDEEIDETIYGNSLYQADCEISQSFVRVFESEIIP